MNELETKTKPKKKTISEKPNNIIHLTMDTCIGYTARSGLLKDNHALGSWFKKKYEKGVAIRPKIIKKSRKKRWLNNKRKALKKSLKKAKFIYFILRSIFGTL